MPTVVHLCFGYAAVVPGSNKPAGYSFLAELDDTIAEQISIEAAQPNSISACSRNFVEEDHARGARPRQSRDRDRRAVADRIRKGLTMSRPSGWWSRPIAA